MCTGTHPYIPVSNVAKIEIMFDQDGQTVVNVLHARYQFTPDATALALLADNVHACVTENFMPHYPDQYSLRTIKITSLTTESSPVVERAITPPEFGGDTTSLPMPNNVTVAVKFISALRGRSYRGRMYYPCLTNTQVAGNRLSATGVTDVSTYAGSLLGALAEGNWTPVVVSYCNNKTWRTQGAATDITGFALNEVLDSQRRRLPERGR